MGASIRERDSIVHNWSAPLEFPMEAFLLGFPTTVIHSLPLERLFGVPGALDSAHLWRGYSQFSERLPAASW